MLNSEINLHAQNFPQGFARDFDAHVYYEPQCRAKAEAFRQKALSYYSGRPILVGALVDRNVGPHPTPMFEINFANQFFGEVVLWLMQNRDGLSILVHQVTGDDPKDHYAGALWLGEKLVLDDSKLDPSPANA